MKYLILSVLLTLYSSASEIIVDSYFQNCNKTGQVLDNGYFKTCYNYDYKSATVSYIEINGENVDMGNIRDRFDFYEDRNIPSEHRTKDSDYLNSGFDRGHIQSDASNDYSEESRNATYVMSNITLQYPNTNRRSYFKVEKRERELASEYRNIKVLTLIEYSRESIRGIRIPLKYTKMFWNNNFKECYIIKNDNIIYSLEQMKVDCLLIL